MKPEDDNIDVQILASLQDIRETQPEWVDFINNDSNDGGFWQDPDIIQLNSTYKGTLTPFILILRKRNKILCIIPGTIEKTPLQLNFSIFKIPGPSVRLLKILNSSIIFSRGIDHDFCISKVMETLYNLEDRFDIIKLEVLEETNPLCKYFELSKNKARFQLKATSPKKEHVWRHYLAETYDDWLNTLGKSTKRLTKRRVKTLYNKFPDQIEFKTITKVTDIHDFLNQLDELYPKTWQAKTFGQSKRNASKDLNFYKKIADLGFLRSYLLLIDKRPVAFLIATQYADTFEAQEIGYDAEYSSIGIGSTLNYMILKDLYSHDKPTILSFGFGDNTYKEILCNDKISAYEAYLTKRNLAGLFIKFQTVLNTVEYKVRHYLIMYKLDDKIRKILKKK